VPNRLALALITLSACMAAALVALLLAGPAAPERRPGGWAGAIRPPGARAPDFALRSQDGRRVSMAGLRGRPVVVTFVYSHCRDSCPATVQTIRGALDDIGRDVPVLGISVDPPNDTVASARRFLNEQHMTGRMELLLGTRAQLAPVWRAFGIAPQRDDEEHTSYIVLVDGAGLQRIGFPFSAQTPEGVAHDLRRLLSERRA
jgi:protein SCO1/2